MFVVNEPSSLLNIKVSEIKSLPFISFALKLASIFNGSKMFSLTNSVKSFPLHASIIKN